MASSADIVKAILASGRPTSVEFGMAKRKVARDPVGAAGVHFARDLEAAGAPQRPQYPARPEHGREARNAESASRREAGSEGSRRRELTPVELAWLQRLPRDPAAVSFDDASRLAGIASSAGSLTPMSRHLVETIWAPIRDVHDRRTAQHQLELASAPLPPIPDSALPALRATVAREHPDWPELAVSARARELLDQAIDQRDAQRGAEQRRARAELARVDEAAARRQETTRSGAREPWRTSF